MTLKPLSGSFVSLFTATASGASGKAAARNDAARAVFKETKSGPPSDKVEFSAQALAALKSGAAMPVQAKAIAPASAATAASATLAKAPGGGATAAPAATPSAPQATAAPLDGTDTPPLLLNIDGTLPRFDPHRNDEIMAYHETVFAHHLQRNDLLRKNFGLPQNIEDGGGLALSGNIAKVIDRTMVLDGAVLPEKPPALLAKEQGAAASPSTMPEGSASTSMITLYLPGSQGTGSEQIEIMFDDKAMAKLAGMSPDAVKAGMIDMLAGTEQGAAGNAAMKKGMMGKMMEENAGWHPEFAASKARFGIFDPDQGTNAQPMMMIQSESRPDYVKEHVGDLVDAVMGLLRGAAPTATTPGPAVPTATASA
ncbi:hypothetical protein JHL17_34175 [Azospirillum sp. YIM B02556]|uniref:Uncharacterized protein n=1 Tax=Azospirillum endophyticum TaxID=2800326 RepID=A0ABS1FGB5_9PROT|nr:hypothetical protein [Azospirillum endophyticum]MBK1842455.1 hypothetical protein [Azospirillum endophyticum]